MNESVNGLGVQHDASEDNSLPVIRKACLQSNVELDSIGMGSRNVTSRPEDKLLGYDLVFAKGRSALEALAVGAAVVLCDTARVGPMVNNGEYGKVAETQLWNTRASRSYGTWCG